MCNLLSIIIPTYNGKEFIFKTLDSVSALSCQKEVIVIDDGSSDDTFCLLQDYCKTHDFITLVKQSNGGIASARNYGLKFAKGDYVLFCDHDDLIVPKTIVKELSEARKRKLDFVFWSTQKYVSDELKLPLSVISKEQSIARQDICEILKKMIFCEPYENMSFICSVWAGLYKRENILKSNITLKRFVDTEDDFLFVFDFLRASSCGLLIPEVGYYWRYNLKSETYRKKKFDDIVDKNLKFYSYLKEGLLESNISFMSSDDFDSFIIQEIVVSAIQKINSGFFSYPDENKLLNRFYKKNISYFKEDNIVDYKGSNCRVYFLLRHGFYDLARLYARCISIYRILRGNIKLKALDIKNKVTMVIDKILVHNNLNN